MARKRFNANRICSSDNYEQSRKVHFRTLEENHRNNESLFKSINISIKIDIKVIQAPYVMVFGQLISITREEAVKIAKELVIYK